MKGKFTPWILTVAIILLIVYDIYAATTGNETTISRVVRDFGRDHPTVLLATGYLLGHFWPITTKRKLK